jgi:polysaccharide biosynthesis/export protein
MQCRGNSVTSFVALTISALMFHGCAPMQPPNNRELALFDREKDGQLSQASLSFSSQRCPPAGTSDFLQPSTNKRLHSRLASLRMLYSPGDRINLLVPGSPDFSGDYVINADGRVILPFSASVFAVGLSNNQLSRQIERALVSAKLFQANDFQVSVRPVLYAAINVTVSGAVFLPGRVLIGGIKDADKGEKALNKSGDNPADRFVAAALRAGGGVRPDADVSQINLVRNGRNYVLDWRGAMSGAPVDDIALVEGDHIEVGQASCFQSALVRPSQITPPGIRIFQSNLTVPAISNANSAVGQHSQSVPYGTRFLAGLVATNCVGGSLATNGRRYGVLISRNPKTLRTEVIQRSIEELVRSADRDTINPYLMPDDAIACYDSGVTDVKEAATVLQTLLLPGQTGQVLKLW